MMDNTGYSVALEELIKLLPSANSNLSSNRNPIDAFQLGFTNGRESVSTNTESALLSLPESTNPRNKSCEAAYLKGCEIGTKVRNSIEFAEQCACGRIPLPKIRKFKGVDRTPRYYYKINDKFIVSVSSGTISQYDIIARYWQYDFMTSNWKKSRQPKHIHWAVDLLIKNEYDKNVVATFINRLIEDWQDNTIIKHITNENELAEFLNPEELLKYVFVEAEKYSAYDIHGEYPMELLILLSRLLMTQERTNREDAYMFKNLIDSFNKTYVDFFDVVDIATFRHQ